MNILRQEYSGVLPTDEALLPPSLDDEHLEVFVEDAERDYLAEALAEGNIDAWYAQAGIEPHELLEQDRLNLNWAVAWLAMGGTIERNGVVLDGAQIFGHSSHDDEA